MVPSLCIYVFEATLFFTISKTKHTESISSQRQTTSVENITLQLWKNSRRWRQPESSAGPRALQYLMTNLLISQVWDKHTTYALSKILLLWENIRSVRHFSCIKLTSEYSKQHTNIYMCIYTYCQTVQYCLLLLPHKLQGKQSKQKCYRSKGSFLLSCQGKLILHSTIPATLTLVLKLLEPRTQGWFLCLWTHTCKSDPTDAQEP